MNEREAARTDRVGRLATEKVIGSHGEGRVGGEACVRPIYTIGRPTAIGEKLGADFLRYV